jgi:hypothetical protein
VTTPCAAMQTADTIEQRLSRLSQQKKNLTIGELLTVVRGTDDLRSYAFQWALCKVGWRLDSESQKFRDFMQVLRTISRYGSVSAPPAAGTLVSIAAGSDC